MYFIAFEGTVSPNKQMLSEEYYGLLQPLLSQQPGFISETGYASMRDPNGQVLIAQFADKQSIHSWRNQSDHLRIQRQSRVGVFQDYHLRIGQPLPEETSETSSTSQQIMVLYTQPVQEDVSIPNEMLELLDNRDDSVAESLSADLIDANSYRNETDVLWISGWRSAKSAKMFSQSLNRVEGDALHQVQIEREYGKFDRKDAPRNAEETHD
jgi:heme-degrading monooxygenase HmoA